MSRQTTVRYLVFPFLVVVWLVAFLISGSIPAADPPDPKINPKFDPNSFWYAPIEENVALHPDSKKLVTAFIRQKAAGKDNIVGINTTEYACPIYIAEKDTPTVAVKVDDCLGLDPSVLASLKEQFRAVPIPAKAAPADGDDAEMAIYQPATDTLWEFWQAQKNKDGSWQACYGGRLDNVSKSSGIWPAPFGGTASGLPFAGGQITAEELKDGEIKHVMGIALVKATSKIFSWPATHTDGVGWCNELCIPEGLRFRLNPAVKVDELDMTPAGKIIARAAQKYGFVVWDKAATTSLRAKNPKSYTQLGGADPYPGLLGDQWTVLNGFPWEKLQFLPMDYGKPALPGKDK